MSKSRTVFFLALAMALAAGTLALASLASAQTMEWLSSLSLVETKLITPSLVVLAALFLALAGYLRSMREAGDSE